MVEPEFDPKTGVWRCPVCGFKAMSKKVVMNHIQREHSALNNRKHEGTVENSNKTSKKRKWKRFKIGDTTIKMLDRDEIEVKDQRGWAFFLTANYVAALHKKKVRVKLITGEELEGLLKARDPYFIALILPNGRKLYINKAHILWIEPLREEEKEK